MQDNNSGMEDQRCFVHVFASEKGHTPLTGPEGGGGGNFFFALGGIQIPCFIPSILNIHNHVPHTNHRKWGEMGKQFCGPVNRGPKTQALWVFKSVVHHCLPWVWVGGS